MKNKSLFLIFISMIFCPLSAQEAGPNKLIQGEKPIGLVADKGFYDQEKGIAIYEGNVVVTQEEMIIWTDKLTITLVNGDATLIKAETLGAGRITRFEFKSKNSNKKKLIRGHSKKIDYQVAKKLVTLITDAVVSQGDDKITGDKLTYNLNNESIGGSRIKMTFNPTKK